MSLSPAWQRTLAITPKFSSLLSVMSSSSLVCIIIRKFREKNKNESYHRIMLGMSCCDIIVSTAWFFSTWPMLDTSPDVYGAVGTVATCSAQGFFAQITLATICYSGTLSIYYLLILVYKWDKAKFAKIEPFLHLVSLTLGIGTAIIGLALKLYNPAGYSCWIAKYPSDCGSGDEEPNCIRGNNDHFYKWMFLYIPLWIVIIVVTICMIRVYWSVSQEEKRNRYFTDTEDEPDVPNFKRKKNSRRIANRAGLYVSAFYLTWIMPTILEIIYSAHGDMYPGLIFLSGLLIPLQGVWNLVIYTLPAFAKYRKRTSVKDEFLLLIWVKMLADELGWIKDDQEDEFNDEDETNEGRKSFTMTLSDWMNNPGASSISNGGPATSSRSIAASSTSNVASSTSKVASSTSNAEI